MNFNEYLEKLAENYLQHSEKECHFSSSMVFSAKVPRLMKYPCMAVEMEDWQMSGLNGNEYVEIDLTLYFLSHVKDTGNGDDLQNAFSENFKNSILVIKQIRHDEYVPDSNIPQYFDTSNIASVRIDFKEAGLYGYAVSLKVMMPFDKLACIIENE